MNVGHSVRMQEQKDRLIQAIRDAGFSKPTDAWRANQRALDISQDLMISNTNGNRPISKKAAEKYARVFGRTAGWYLYGEGGSTPAPTTGDDLPTGQVREPKAVRKLLNRIGGLTPANVKVLLSAIQGFQQANASPPSQDQHRGQSAHANRRHEVKP
jgi:hypothetical protein